MKRYDAIVLDADGTLLNSDSEIRPRVLESLVRAMESGVLVMLATGRSAQTAREVGLALGSPLPSIVFNGGGLYCPFEDRMLELRTLEDTVVSAFIERARELDCFWLASQHDTLVISPPRTSEERQLTRQFKRVVHHDDGDPHPQEVIRISTVTARFSEPDALYEPFSEIHDPTAAISRAFPLREIPAFRKSKLQILEFESHSAGKREALLYLEREHGIPAERVVAVGDANNDLPMLEHAGLSVAMENATPEAKAASDRTIGNNDSLAIANLITELFS
jgi:Cof subfamily protein (haloacid dehalogenase superfamily)